tara:strand:+ start:12110 stop:12586 length:477 start_codon:yes stop_codon:yes gene_type:complete
MKIDVITIIALTLLAAMPSPSWAGGNPVERPDAEAMIKACWDASLEKRSSPSIRMIYDGIYDTVLCLEDRIVDQFKDFSPNLTYYDTPNDERPTIEQVRDRLKGIRHSSGALYWWIYNENPSCERNCGEIFYTFHLTENAAMLEHMLKVMVAERLRLR